MSDNPYTEPEIGEDFADGMRRGSEDGVTNPPLPDYAQPQKGSDADETTPPEGDGDE